MRRTDRGSTMTQSDECVVERKYVPFTISILLLAGLDARHSGRGRVRFSFWIPITLSRSCILPSTPSIFLFVTTQPSPYIPKQTAEIHQFQDVHSQIIRYISCDCYIHSMRV